MSGAGKEDKPDKDYWKTGDPALRAKVISSVGVIIVVLSIIGSASFNSYDYYYYGRSPQQTSQEQDDTDEERDTGGQASEDKSNIEEQSEPAAQPAEQEETSDETSMNNVPIADGGDDQTVYANTDVTLDGSNSIDKDGTLVSYKWEQTGGPKVHIKDSNKAMASFNAPSVSEDSKLAFKLTVKDDQGAQKSDKVSINVKSNTGEQPPAPPSTEPPADMTPPADISTIAPVILFLLFIVGIFLAIVGLISYLRRRKKAIH